MLWRAIVDPIRTHLSTLWLIRAQALCVSEVATFQNNLIQLEMPLEDRPVIFLRITIHIYRWVYYELFNVTSALIQMLLSWLSWASTAHRCGREDDRVEICTRICMQAADKYSMYLRAIQDSVRANNRCGYFLIEILLSKLLLLLFIIIVIVPTMATKIIICNIYKLLASCKQTSIRLSGVCAARTWPMPPWSYLHAYIHTYTTLFCSLRSLVCGICSPTCRGHVCVVIL